MSKAPHANKLDRVRKGMTFGKLTILQKVRSPKDVYGYSWKVACSCGSEPFNIREQYLFRKANPKVDCGCSAQTIITKYRREYHIWKMMNRRCYVERHISWPWYGALGVKVHLSWYDADGASFAQTLKAFGQFLKDVGPAPSKKHSLDRYPNPAGNYEPGNVRWATATEQASNKRRKAWQQILS
jgi:hypothetical protein